MEVLKPLLMLSSLRLRGLGKKSFLRGRESCEAHSVTEPHRPHGPHLVASGQFRRGSAVDEPIASGPQANQRRDNPAAKQERSSSLPGANRPLLIN